MQGTATRVLFGLFGIRIQVKRLARTVFVLAIGTAGACASQGESVEARRLAIATGDESGVYYLLGHALAQIYNERIPDVATSALETTGSGFNVQAVEEGRAELAFSQADVAYLALQQGTRDHPEPYRHLRAMAVLYVNAVQIVALRESNLYHLSDLEARRVGVGAPDSGTELAARIILRAQGLENRIAGEPLAFDDLASRMQSRAIDAGFFVSSYPVPAVARLNAAAGVRFLPVEADLADRIRTDFPFYRPVAIPNSTYVGQQGDIATIGVDNLLVCHSDLPDDLIYQSTRLLFESLSSLADAHAAAAAIDPEQASATPIPLHPGAARFYRERELFR